MDTVTASEEARPSGTQTRILILPGGRRIACADYGDPQGLPVLALHGTPGSRLMFALVDDAARARGIRLIAPERLGYGLSDYHRHASLVHAAEDVSAVADAYGLERFALVGVSGGGPFAVAAASANLDRVALLALASPVGPVAELGRGLPMTRFHRLIFHGLARSDWATRGFFRALRHLLRARPDTAYRWLLRCVRASDRELLARPEVKANLQAAIREGLRPGVEGAVQDLRLICAPWRLRLAAIDVPAILWQGSNDTIVPPAVAYALARMLPHCRLEVIPAGHYWVFGQFGMILDAVADALRADTNTSVAKVE